MLHIGKITMIDRLVKVNALSFGFIEVYWGINYEKKWNWEINIEIINLNKKNIK